MLRKVVFRTKANPGTREMVPKCFDTRKSPAEAGLEYARRE
jgi:hypothetical protein